MEWFNNSSLENISLIELTNALVHPQGTIQLPSFQRDAVWNQEHVELLWDSVTRGFPVGSLLFGRAKDFLDKIKVREYQDSAYATAKMGNAIRENIEYIIIDGQQRSIALSLGFRDFRPGNSARLWIDLGYYDGTSTARYFMCDVKKPWGLEATSPQIVKALRCLGIEEDLDRENPDLLNKTWPLRALIPVPFYDFWNKVIVDDGKPDLKELVPLWIPDTIRNGFFENKNHTYTIAEIVKNLKKYRIPVYLIENMESAKDLGLAFQRINRQGVSMTNEDLFFSGLKLAWPDAHDLVWEIYSDPKTGKFMSPNRIVHNVVRLTASYVKPGKRDDILDLNLEEFEKLIEKDDSGNGAFISTLKSYLLKKNEREKSRYHRLLLKAKQFLLFVPEGGKNTQFLLPLPLIAKINRRVWHAITAWLDHHDNIDPESEEAQSSRKEMIRYALFDHLALGGISTSLARIPFKLACDERFDVFPGYYIYRIMRETGILSDDFLLFTPVQFMERLTDKDGLPVGNILLNEEDIVMWNQREYSNKWFPKYDPTLYRGADDLPYDWDHIIAAYHFDMRGKGRSEGDVHKDFWAIRNRLAGCSGNFRVWPKSLNRSDRDGNLWDKYILGKPDFEITSQKDGQEPYLRRKPYNMNSVDDVRKASCITDDPKKLKQWKIASNCSPDDHIDKSSKWVKEHDWSRKDRLKAFINAVQNRRVDLYTAMYEKVGFNEWNDKWEKDKKRGQNKRSFDVEDLIKEITTDE